MSDTGTQYLGLTSVERAAAMVDPHMQACDAPTIGDCRYCQNRLATIRELVAAVSPVIRQQVAEEIAHAIHDRFDHLKPEWHSNMISVAEWCEGEAHRRSHSTQPEEETTNG